MKKITLMIILFLSISILCNADVQDDLSDTNLRSTYNIDSGKTISAVNFRAIFTKLVEGAWTKNSSNNDIYFNKGKVGIGIDNPDVKLDCNGTVRSNSVAPIFEFFESDENKKWFIVADGGEIDIRENSTSGSNERFKIESGGNVGIGNVNPTEKLHVNGNIRANATVYTSDIRYKKNINSIQNALKKVTNLRGVLFNWKTEKYQKQNFKTKRDLGLIAQEVEKEFPQLVHTDKKGYKSIAYSKLTAVLVQAVKELKQQQDKKVSDLKRKFTHQQLIMRKQNLIINQLEKNNKQMQKELAEIKQMLKK